MKKRRITEGRKASRAIMENKTSPHSPLAQGVDLSLKSIQHTITGKYKLLILHWKIRICNRLEKMTIMRL